MRDELIEFIASAKKDIPLTELCSVCKDMAEFELVLDLFSKLHADDDEEDVEETLSNKIKMLAYKEFENTPKWELKTSLVQRRLKVGYGTASRVREWLLKIK